MTALQLTDATAASKAALLSDLDFLREIVRATLQEVLEAEMTDALGAAEAFGALGKRASGALSAEKGRRRRARRGAARLSVGPLRPHAGHPRGPSWSCASRRTATDGSPSSSSRAASARSRRSSPRWRRCTCRASRRGRRARSPRSSAGHAFSASAISQVDKTLYERLAAFAARRLEEPFAYLILDARCERVREGGVVRSQAVHIAVGVNWDGRRQSIGVELAARESRSSWRDFLRGLVSRGLHGVQFVVADDHASLRAALREAAYQRCYVHFLKNALDHLPRKADDDRLRELRWLYDRRDLAEARANLAVWLAKWEARHPRFTAWAEDAIEETPTFYRLPRRHHKHLKSANMPERFNEEIKRRTYVVRIFPDASSCLRLVRALAVETHENWLEANRYLNMDDLKEQKKIALRKAA